MKSENEILKLEVKNLKLNSTQDYDYSLSSDYAPKESEVAEVIDEITKKSVELLHSYVDTHYSKLKKKAKKIVDELSRLDTFARNISSEAQANTASILNIIDTFESLPDDVAHQKADILQQVQGDFTNFRIPFSKNVIT